MEWEQMEERWREVKCRLTSNWVGTARSSSEGKRVRARKRPLTAARKRRLVADYECWKELEASILRDDVEQLIRDFEASGSHH